MLRVESSPMTGQLPLLRMRNHLIRHFSPAFNNTHWGVNATFSGVNTTEFLNTTAIVYEILKLQDLQTYYFVVRAWNYAGLSSTGFSSGITVYSQLYNASTGLGGALLNSTTLGSNGSSVLLNVDQQTRQSASLNIPPDLVTPGSTLLVSQVTTQTLQSYEPPPAPISVNASMNDTAEPTPPSYIPPDSNAPTAFSFQNFSFVVNLYNDTTKEKVHDLPMPLEVVVNYNLDLDSSEPFKPVDASSFMLMLFNTTSQTWVDAANTCDPRHVVNDPLAQTLTISVCHLTQYGMFYQYPGNNLSSFLLLFSFLFSF